MLYPIVTVLALDEIDGPDSLFVMWFANEDDRRYDRYAIVASSDGAFVANSGKLATPIDLAEFIAAVQEAWDAVRAIRHGTSLERFPRDLSGQSERSGADQ